MNGVTIRAPESLLQTRCWWEHSPLCHPCPEEGCLLRTLPTCPTPPPPQRGVGLAERKGRRVGVQRPASCTGVRGPSAPPGLGCSGQPKERLQPSCAAYEQAGVHLTGTQPQEAHCRPSSARDQGKGSLSCFARLSGSSSGGGAIHPNSPSPNQVYQTCNGLCAPPNRRRQTFLRFTDETA